MAFLKNFYLVMSFRQDRLCSVKLSFLLLEKVEQLMSAVTCFSQVKGAKLIITIRLAHYQLVYRIQYQTNTPSLSLLSLWSQRVFSVQWPSSIPHFNGPLLALSTVSLKREKATWSVGLNIAAYKEVKQYTWLIHDLFVLI